MFYVYILRCSDNSLHVGFDPTGSGTGRNLCPYPGHQDERDDDHGRGVPHDAVLSVLRTSGVHLLFSSRDEQRTLLRRHGRTHGLLSWKMLRQPGVGRCGTCQSRLCSGGVSA